MKRVSSALFFALALPAASWAQHTGHSPDMTHAAPVPTLTEPGQGAFAALAEVVRVLEADPGTEWSRVDLDALRAHLVDMDLLATRASAEVEEIEGGLAARATGDGSVLAALKRMVPAHAAQLATDQRWRVAARDRGDSVELVVTSDDPATQQRIRALGFFGLMASQDHHRAHHLSIARGTALKGH